MKIYINLIEKKLLNLYKIKKKHIQSLNKKFANKLKKLNIYIMTKNKLKKQKI